MSSPFLDGLFSLYGRVALISGASRGIGFAIAEGMVRAGAHTYGLGRSVAPEAGGGFAYMSCDIADAERFERACARVVSDHGRLDIYVHAAGITLPEAVEREPLAAFTRTIDVNLTAVYRCCLVAIRHMGQAGGSIINISSIGSALGFPGNPGYVASKGGLSALTRALAVDVGSKNIRVNSLAPGYIRTAMTEQSYADPAKREARLGHMILKRWGTPRDLVGAAVFLASEASAYVTGQELFVDGGWTAKGL